VERFRRIRTAAELLDSSPVVKLLIATAAVVSFIITVGSGGWNWYQAVRTERLGPTIEIGGRTNFELTALVPSVRLFGPSHFTSEAEQTQTVMRLPYFPVTLNAANPLSKPVSLVDCALSVGFFEREGRYVSTAYFRESEFENATRPNPIIRLEPGEYAREELMFFFLPEPEFAMLSSDSTTQPFRFQLECKDENGAQIESRVR
jgi:hypothetical protein